MSNYYYLASSLPMLQFGSRLPFSFEEFLKVCSRLIPEEDSKVLSDLPKPEDYGLKEISNHILREWVDFDSALRNELAKVRMRKKNIDASSDLRPSSCTDYTLSQIALSASRLPSVIDAERFLDEKRWQAWDDLLRGHFFDLEFIIGFAYKLMILERWEKIRTADKEKLIEVVTSI